MWPKFFLLQLTEKTNFSALERLFNMPFIDATGIFSFFAISLVFNVNPQSHIQLYMQKDF